MNKRFAWLITLLILAAGTLAEAQQPKEEMKNCVWLTEWTPDGHLRHSKFVGLRDDKDARRSLREIEDSEALRGLGVGQ